MSDYFMKKTTTQVLEITIGNVTFTVDSNDPDAVRVTTCAEADFDIEQVHALAGIAAHIDDFVAGLPKKGAA